MEFIHFIKALIAPLFYSFSNQLDKHMLEEHMEDSAVEVLVIFSAIAQIISLPLLYALDPDIFSMGFQSVKILFLAGIINVGVIYFYLKALEEDDPTIVVIFYQIVPVLVGLFAYVLLGETLSKTQIVAGAVILLGTTVASFEVTSENTLRLKGRTVGYMLLACTFWASETVIFKFAAIEEGERLWSSLFWEHTATVAFGGIIILLDKRSRIAFMNLFKSKSRRVISLCYVNEVVYMCGSIAEAHVTLLTTVALVFLVNTSQPFFVFAIGIGIAFLLPRYITERVQKKDVLQKIVALVITAFGSYLLIE